MSIRWFRYGWKGRANWYSADIRFKYEDQSKKTLNMQYGEDQRSQFYLSLQIKVSESDSGLETKVQWKLPDRRWRRRQVTAAAEVRSACYQYFVILSVSQSQFLNGITMYFARIKTTECNYQEMNKWMNWPSEAKWCVWWRGGFPSTNGQLPGSPLFPDHL